MTLYNKKEDILAHSFSFWACFFYDIFWED